MALAVGCGGSGGPPPGRVSAVAAYDIGPAPRSAVRDGGTLRLATTEFRTQWNLWHLGGADLDAGNLLRAVMPFLFRSDEHGRVTPDPDYLTSARLTRRTPKQVVTYDIDPRATWSDGTPIGYRDFRALWRACAGTDRDFQATASAGYRSIESVRRGRGERQVVVTFTRPFGEWRSLFSPLYPAKGIGTPAAWDTAWLGAIPISAGPFRLGRIDRVTQTIMLVRDPHWWGDRPKLDRVVFRRLDRDALPGAFAAGEIDAFDAGADAVAYRRARAVSGASIRRAAGPDFTQITFNGASPMLSDAAVRRAVAMAVDRSVLARSALAGLGWPVRTLDDHVYLNGQPGYRDNAGRVGAYDPASAARALDRAGWRRSGRWRRVNGREAALRYVFPASAVDGRRSGELVQAMLRRVGVRVVLRPVPDDAFFDRYLVPGDFDLAPFSWIGTPFPVADMTSVYGRPRGGDIGQNVARIGSRRLDALLARAAADLDPVRARREANAADVLIWRSVHSLTLYQRPQIVPARSSLANWGAFGFRDPVWTDVGFTH